ncbi:MULTISPECIES: DUF6585 family protein [Kitasatospora]|uniref:PH (Pleckstrin Homology) domain-containing protein n=2 Tax=Kitasatospora TaxID=2063 RepID=A0ABT1J766_9ACTN|nr:DUF6585 family protein [Kitasatospora paracochleata]MCP2313281.1 hypothetical protein [Kitasatospora paracochleata]
MAAPTVPVTQERLPEAVEALAAAHGLGPHRETFLPKRQGVLWMAGMVFFVLLGLLLFVLPGLFFGYLLLQSPNVSRKKAAHRLHFFEYGLVVADHTGPVEAFRWDSMAVLQQITRRYANGVYVGTTYLYTLYKQDGSTLKLTNFFANPERWGLIIQHAITNSQLPGVLAALGNGETVRFGDIAVTTGGVATPKRGSVAWSEIQRFEIKNGVVFLAKAGKLLAWSNTPVAKIPNFFLFLATVDRLRQLNAAA